MSVRSWLDRAGRFDVEQLGGIPHYNQATDLLTPRAGVLHTTEGNWAGSLGVFKQHFAPHFLLGYDEVQKRVRIAQLVQVGTIGAALVTHNWLALVQVEMIGYSKEQPWLPEDETVEALASLMAVCKSEYGIPLSRPWPDGVYGMARANDPHRAGGQFGHVAGWYGHGDMPSPDSHWDPGALQWRAIFSRAAAASAPHAPSPQAPAASSSPCSCAAPDAPPKTSAADMRDAIVAGSLSLMTIKGVQSALVALGARITIDDDNGAETRAAIAGFQRAHSLVADGDAGPLTKAAILKSLAA